MPRTVVFYETGGPEVLRIENTPDVSPDPGEVVIDVEAIGLNRAEALYRMGQYLEEPKSFPAKLGYEAAGRVSALGPGVAGFSVGQRVSTIPAFSMRDYGMYGDQVVAPASAVAAYPENLSPVQGASIWMQYLTAYGALVHFGQLRPEQTVLISAASSSVGIAAIQLVKSIGATSIATTRSSRKKAALIAAGATKVIATEEEDLVKAVHETTGGKGIDLVFDPVAGKFVETLAQICAAGATIFEYGALSGEPTPFPLVLALQKGLSVRGYTLFELHQNPAARDEALKFVFERLESGELVPLVDKTFPFEQVVAAHRYMEENNQIGKIVLEV
jgi:NADPH:quinone reductase